MSTNKKKIRLNKTQNNKIFKILKLINHEIGKQA